ncbi:hypothetical protein [Demequina sp. SO4-18]|uniref:hypothetical protein n=1 Tax=Demequina sp. SO4-18 TaxID=3401026 RepID=UPI003B5AEF0B
MALAPLATTADLDARRIDTSDMDLADALLASASAGVREGAGCSITAVTGTITLDGGARRSIGLPGWAVRNVSSVLWDGSAASDWRLRDAALFRPAGWGDDYDPPELTVTYTQGVDECPADIVDLVCSLVAAGMVRAEDGYDPRRGVSSERIDDYQISFTRGADEVVAPMQLPEGTRAWLSVRFGGGVHVTQERA